MKRKTEMIKSISLSARLALDVRLDNPTRSESRRSLVQPEKAVLRKRTKAKTSPRLVPEKNGDKTRPDKSLRVAQIASSAVAPINLARADLEERTPLTLYMQEVGLVDLITPQQEIELAARIKKGDEEARQHMIKANLRLVVKIARGYENLGLPLLDLINEGNIGLMKAVERFDPSKGGKLSTYGSWWIKQSMRRALANQSKTIRLPVHVVDRIFHINRAAFKFQELYGREATPEELGLELDLEPSQITHLRQAAIRPASLDASLSDEDSGVLADIIRDENSGTPYELLEDKTNRSMLHELVEKLPLRESTILRCRFGLDGDPEKTLEEVGKKFGVTRERIRQLQNSAMRKLRAMIEEREALQVTAA